jgi:carboxylesterase type B
MQNNCAKRFIAALNQSTASHPDIAHRILDTYQISEDTPDEEAISSILMFFTDISFHSSTLSFARGWNGNAYVYYFNEGNPWDGPWKGRANHILDVIYFFQNLRDSLTPEQKQVGEAFAEDLFKFCHGIAPWPAVTPGTIDTGFSARLYGPSQKGTIASVASQAFGGETMRRSILFECSSVVSLDDLAKVFVTFQSS